MAVRGTLFHFGRLLQNSLLTAVFLVPAPLLFAANDVFDIATGKSYRGDSEGAKLRPETESFSAILQGHDNEVVRRIERELGDGGSEEISEEESTGERILKSIEWGFVAEGELASNLNSNIYSQAQTDAVYTADLGFLMKLTPRATFYGLLEAGYGWGLDGRIPSFAGFNDEIDLEHRIHFSQAWYEQKFGADDRWRFKIGQLDICCDFDTNDYANCGYHQFNSSGFVVNLTFEHPSYTFGTELWRDISDNVSIGAAYLSDETWSDVFSSGSGILEADFHITPNDHPGNYRFYGWVNESDLFYEDDQINSGWGISLDQELAHRLGVWGRVGFGNGAVGVLKSHITGGIRFQHLNQVIDRDVIGLAYGIATAGKRYAESVEFDPVSEHFIETYYLRRLSDNGHVSPFIQYVIDPAGEKEAGNIFVLGFRGVIEI